MIQPSYNQQDELLHMTLMDGQVRALLATTRQLTQAAADMHHTTPVCTAAMGRLMTGTAMMGAMLKGARDSVTVTIKGSGPIGTMIAVSIPGQVKACLDNPQLQLPLSAEGKLDVGSAVGREGRMTVVKDMGLREPYIGQVALVSGEIAEDFTMYFAKSEQQPSLVSLGVLVNGDQVLQSGGLLIQPMPGCTEDTVDQLELRSPIFASISNELNYAPIEELAQDWFKGLAPVILDRQPLNYACGCSRERMERALVTIGQKELSQLISEDQGAELGCHFCHSHYAFTTSDLMELLKQATRA